MAMKRVASPSRMATARSKIVSKVSRRVPEISGQITFEDENDGPPAEKIQENRGDLPSDSKSYPNATSLQIEKSDVDLQSINERFANSKRLSASRGRCVDSKKIKICPHNEISSAPNQSKLSTRSYNAEEEFVDEFDRLAVTVPSFGNLTPPRFRSLEEDSDHDEEDDIGSYKSHARATLRGDTAEPDYWAICYGPKPSNFEPGAASAGLWSASRLPPAKSCLSSRKSDISQKQVTLMEHCLSPISQTQWNKDPLSTPGATRRTNFDGSSIEIGKFLATPKTVKFGEVDAAEFDREKPAIELTPMTSEAVRLQFSLDERVEMISEETKLNGELLAQFENGFEENEDESEFFKNFDTSDQNSFVEENDPPVKNHGRASCKKKKRNSLNGRRARRSSSFFSLGGAPLIEEEVLLNPKKESYFAEDFISNNSSPVLHLTARTDSPSRSCRSSLHSLQTSGAFLSPNDDNTDSDDNLSQSESILDVRISLEANLDQAFENSIQGKQKPVEAVATYLSHGDEQRALKLLKNPDFEQDVVSSELLQNIGLRKSDLSKQERVLVPFICPSEQCDHLDSSFAFLAASHTCCYEMQFSALTFIDQRVGLCLSANTIGNLPSSYCEHPMRGSCSELIQKCLQKTYDDWDVLNIMSWEILTKEIESVFDSLSDCEMFFLTPSGDNVSVHSFVCHELLRDTKHKTSHLSSSLERQILINNCLEDILIVAAEMIKSYQVSFKSIWFQEESLAVYKVNCFEIENIRDEMIEVRWQSNKYTIEAQWIVDETESAAPIRWITSRLKFEQNAPVCEGRLSDLPIAVFSSRSTKEADLEWIELLQPFFGSPEHPNQFDDVSLPLFYVTQLASTFKLMPEHLQIDYIASSYLKENEL